MFDSNDNVRYLVLTKNVWCDRTNTKGEFTHSFGAVRA